MSGWQGGEQQFLLDFFAEQSQYFATYPSGTQNLYMHRAFKMAPRSLKLNAAAETMNSDELLTMMDYI